MTPRRVVRCSKQCGSNSRPGQRTCKACHAGEMKATRRHAADRGRMRRIKSLSGLLARVGVAELTVLVYDRDLTIRVTVSDNTGGTFRPLATAERTTTVFLPGNAFEASDVPRGTKRTDSETLKGDA